MNTKIIITTAHVWTAFQIEYKHKLSSYGYGIIDVLWVIL